MSSTADNKIRTSTSNSLNTSTVRESVESSSTDTKEKKPQPIKCLKRALVTVLNVGLLGLFSYVVFRTFRMTQGKIITTTEERSFAMHVPTGKFVNTLIVNDYLGVSSAPQALQVFTKEYSNNIAGEWYHVDSSLGLFVAYVASTGEAGAISGQMCSVQTTDKTETRISGLVVTRCASVDDSSTCMPYCSVKYTGDNLQIPSSRYIRKGDSTYWVRDYVVEEYYRLKNSLGFGVTYLTQPVTAVTREESGLVLKTKIIKESRMNSSWWQPIVAYVVLIWITIGIFVRILALPVLAVGVKIRSSVLSVYADLAGGLITSPGVSWATLVLFTISSIQNWTWAEASVDFDISWEHHVCIAIAVATIVQMVLSFFLRKLGIRAYNSGTTLVVQALGIRFLTLNKCRELAQSNVRSLGMVLIRDGGILAGELNGTSTYTTIPVNIADGVGLSGLEIFVKLYFDNFFYTLCCAVATEVIIYLMKFTNCLRMLNRSSKVTAGSRISKQPSQKSNIGNFGGLRNSLKISSYETCLALSHSQSSSFCALWGAPFRTQFGNFFTLSTMLEDNVVLFGPVLLPLPTFSVALLASLPLGQEKVCRFLIQHQLYFGVLVRSCELQSVRENLSDIPEYVNTYFQSNSGRKHIDRIMNPEPLG